MERVMKGITFELPVESEEMNRYIEELAEKYEENLPRIVECMMSDSTVQEIFGGLTRDKIAKELGGPTMRPWKGADGCAISYLKLVGDEMKVLSVECSGVYEDLAYGPYGD